MMRKLHGSNVHILYIIVLFKTCESLIGDHNRHFLKRKLVCSCWSYWLACVTDRRVKSLKISVVFRFNFFFLAVRCSADDCRMLAKRVLVLSSCLRRQSFVFNYRNVHLNMASYRIHSVVRTTVCKCNVVCEHNFIFANSVNLYL
jgi:hypothetical protein